MTETLESSKNGQLIWKQLRDDIQQSIMESEKLKLKAMLKRQPNPKDIQDHMQNYLNSERGIEVLYNMLDGQMAQEKMLELLEFK